jgi:hypothetical protein
MKWSNAARQTVRSKLDGVVWITPSVRLLREDFAGPRVTGEYVVGCTKMLSHWKAGRIFGEGMRRGDAWLASLLMWLVGGSSIGCLSAGNGTWSRQFRRLRIFISSYGRAGRCNEISYLQFFIFFILFVRFTMYGKKGIMLHITAFVLHYWSLESLCEFSHKN